LNEYTSLDFEMGYIRSFQDIMEMETAMLRYTFDLLRREYAGDLKRLGVKVPEFETIPAVRFDEAKQLAAEKYNRPIRDPYDLEPEEEQNIGRYFQEEYGSDLVFITHYPEKKRPFYAMNDPKTRNIPSALTFCSAAWRSPRAGRGSTTIMSRSPRWKRAAWTPRTSRPI
jgi:nondiscriminating aspartyl-tRNA synthetase